MGKPLQIATLSLCLLCCLSACGTETQPRLTDAGPRPARVSPGSAERLDAGGAALVATGRHSFEGMLPARCAVHEEAGLQVNLRTGDPDLPVVTVRIGEIHGGGAYRGQLFVTGRSRTGALAGSTGEVSLDLRAGTGGLDGSFNGSYDGAAGKGSVEGRFLGCPLPRQADSTKIASSVLPVGR